MMDKNFELKKLQAALKIPITDLSFSDAQVEIISGTSNIGAIPFQSVSGAIIYDIPKQEVNWLNWADVYYQNTQLINIKIIQLLGTDEVEVICGSFRNLHIKDENGQLLYILDCSYENDTWTVA